jgi:hypothetical protein
MAVPPLEPTTPFPGPGEDVPLPPTCPVPGIPDPDEIPTPPMPGGDDPLDTPPKGPPDVPLTD